MKKLITLASGLILALSLACFAGCGDDQGNGGGGNGGDDSNITQDDYGTLSIADVNVYYRENATIEPVFSTEAGKGEIEYSFEGSNIAITGNSVKGNKGNTTTVVTAQTAHHKVTFKVNVIFKNPFGKHTALDEGENVFKATANGVYEKVKGDYGVSYYYGKAGALKSNGNVLTGNFTMNDVEGGGNAYFDLVVKESATKAVRFQYTASDENTYTLTSEYMNGESAWGHTQTLRTFEGDYYEAEVAVMADEGSAYIFIDKTYCGKVDIGLGENAHIGVGAANCALVLEKMNDYAKTDEKYGDYVAETTRAFGDNIYANLASDNIFAETATPGVYEKTSKNYGRAFPYADGLPVGGTDWAAKFKITLSDLDSNANSQAAFLIFQDEQNCVRYFVERRPDGTVCVCGDIQTGNAWGDWKPFKEWKTSDTSVTIEFQVGYQNGKCYLWVNGELVATRERDMGNTQLAIGGEKCTITLSEFARAEMTFEEETAKAANVYALPKKTAEAADFALFDDETAGD